MTLSKCSKARRATSISKTKPSIAPSSMFTSRRAFTSALVATTLCRIKKFGQIRNKFAPEQGSLQNRSPLSTLEFDSQWKAQTSSNDIQRHIQSTCDLLSETRPKKKICITVWKFPWRIKDAGLSHLWVPFFAIFSCADLDCPARKRDLKGKKSIKFSLSFLYTNPISKFPTA